MRARTLARVAVTVACAAASSAAGPAFAATPVSPQLDVWIDSWNGAWATICAEGNVDDPPTTTGTWEFVITGARSDGSVTGPIRVTRTGSSFPQTCRDVLAAGPPYGSIAATITFVGVGTAGDIAGNAGLVYEWNGADLPQGETAYSTNR